MSWRQIAKEAGVDYQMFYRRVKKGMEVEAAIAECRAVEDSQEESLSEIARKHGIDYITFYQRVKKLGWSREEAIAGRRHESVERGKTPGSYRVQGEEPKGDPLAFRPLVSQREAILEAVRESGVTLQEWLLDAAMAKLEGRGIEGKPQSPLK